MRTPGPTPPTESQLKLLGKLRTNIANAQARLTKIAEIVERATGEGQDITTPRVVEYDDENSYGLPSLQSSLEGKEKALALRQREYDEYVTKLRARGVMV